MSKLKNMLDYFSVLVIGDNPEDKISKFDSLKDVEKPYIIYSYSDVNKLRLNRIKIYDEFRKNITDYKQIQEINSKIKELELMSDFDYYQSIGELYSYDDEKNIISKENPDGKWISCEIGGKVHSKILKNLKHDYVSSDIVGNIDWNSIHLNQDRVYLYNRTWELCVDKKTPENDMDRKILKNMDYFMNKSDYFSKFKDKNDYIKFNTSFWTYAVITNKGEWVDMDLKDEFEWINNFYNTYISHLPNNTKITIFECTK